MTRPRLLLQTPQRLHQKRIPHLLLQTPQRLHQKRIPPRIIHRVPRDRIGLRRIKRVLNPRLQTLLRVPEITPALRHARESEVGASVAGVDGGGLFVEFLGFFEAAAGEFFFGEVCEAVGVDFEGVAEADSVAELYGSVLDEGGFVFEFSGLASAESVDSVFYHSG